MVFVVGKVDLGKLTTVKEGYFFNRLPLTVGRLPCSVYRVAIAL